MLALRSSPDARVPPKTSFSHARPYFTRDSLSRDSRKLRLEVLGLLSRPALPSHRETLRKALKAPQWKPVDHIGAAELLDPLFLHHMLSSGIPPTAFSPGWPSPEKAQSLLSSQGLSYFHRREIMKELLSALSSHGVGPLLLLKGAALEAAYPTPALRQMCDLDIAFDGEHLSEASAILRNLGWTPAAGKEPLLWRHRSGLLLDIHIPASEFDKEIFQAGEQSESFAASASEVRIPRKAHHLVILALHAERNCGNRLWRDVCDIQALLAEGEAEMACEEALAFAKGHGCLAEMQGMFCFINRHARPPFELPQATALSEPEGKKTKAICALYQMIGVEEAPPLALNLLRFTFFRGGTKENRKRGMQPVEARERDVLLGDLPARGTFQRHWLRARLLWDFLSSGRTRHYWKLIRLQHRLYSSSKKPFS